MLGLWLENKKIKLRDDLEKPTPTHNEALIKVLMSGICNTDIELTKGYYPYTGVLGHEFVGVVEAGPQELLNKRVVGEINLTCDQCNNCLRNLKSHCQKRTVLGIVNKQGAFANYITLPSKNLYLVPDHVSTEAATFTEPLAAALEIQEQVHILPSDKVLVIGDGKLGNLITQTLLLNGCELWLVGRHEKKYLPFAKKGVMVGKENIIQPQYFDIVIECTGNSIGFQLALDAVRPRGTLVMKSTYADQLHLNAATIVVNEITLVGSRCGPFQPALQLLARELIDVHSLIEKIYPLSEGMKAFEHAMNKGSMKIIINNVAK